MLEIDKETITKDYYTVFLSRQLSILGRKEVHSGRAHFGIFGDGKELAQIAYARNFRNGDWRSGYYRDQTFMLEAGLITPEEIFAQIYGDTNLKNNPSTGGRNFNNHFSTANISTENEIADLLHQKNSASDISPTAGQMPRLLGLALASKLVRENSEYKEHTGKWIAGDEVAFGSIGDSSTSEGMFFETVNAACVLQVPLAIAVWDDGFGISVPVELQTTKASISKALAGFEMNEKEKGCKIYTCHGHDYPALLKTFEEGISFCREKHIPVLFHITEMTQPTGHSSSGSHERYKSNERIEWENEFDPIKQFREWILEQKICDSKTLDDIETKAIERARFAKEKAWKDFSASFNIEKADLKKIVDEISALNPSLSTKLFSELKNLNSAPLPTHKRALSFAKNILSHHLIKREYPEIEQKLRDWILKIEEKGGQNYNTFLYSENNFESNVVKPIYNPNPKVVPGNELLNANFDALFQKYPLLVTFGEDTGKLGDTNQGMKMMQEKYGVHRVWDTGIRETTIIGQGIGLALRGFRPIAEIQYLDYLIYALTTISDDLSTLHYRTKGQQIAPLIIRTRGHQLQGMWHSGSPMSMILGSCRGINLCVPRNMTQASGFYNYLLKGNNPAIVIEPLKGYYVHEKLPLNPGEYTVVPGVPEILEKGTDLTIVTYGWNVEIAREAILKLREFGISIELIDVQTLIPFDTHHTINQSVQKTNKILFIDEDVPGGGTAYMLQKVMEEQKAFYYLDAPPRTLSAKDHRGAYGIDGEYFSKPNVETIIETVYEMMNDVNPKKYPGLYR